MKRMNTMNTMKAAAIALVTLTMVGVTAPASVVYAAENNEVEAPMNEERPVEQWWQNVQYYPIDWIRIPYYIPTQETPANTPNEGTPANTPNEGTPANTPNEGTPANTPNEGTPANTPNEGTPANTPNVGTPANLPNEVAQSVMKNEATSRVDDSTAVEVEAQNELSSETDSKSTYDEKMDDLVKEIIKANAEAKKSAKGKKTLYHNDLTELSLKVMKTLSDCPNVVLDMTYSYDGTECHTVITGGITTLFDENTPWYGPLWLYAIYGVK